MSFSMYLEKSTVNGVDGMKSDSIRNSIFYSYRLWNATKWSCRRSRVDLEKGYYWSGNSYRDEHGRFGYSITFDQTDYNYWATWNVNFVKMAIRPVRR